MADLVALVPPGQQRLLRIVYAIRDRHAMSPAAVRALVRAAARANHRQRISGVLLQARGRFVQWLEGPGEALCGLMARIVADPRHDEVRLMSIGWTDRRRFGHWPMHLGRSADDVVACSPLTGFDRLACLHRTPPAGMDRDDIAGFAGELLDPGGDGPSGFPARTGHSLGPRADVVDAVCAELGRRWRENRCCGTEVTVALARLTGLWHRAGRSPEPLRPRGQAIVVVPPGAGEVVGAIVKTDIMRAAGVSVQLVLEETEADAMAALPDEPAPVIVAAPRVGHTGDAGRATALCERLRTRFPDRLVLLGGASSGPIVDLPAHLRLRIDDAAGLPAASVAWAALATVAQGAQRGRPA
ncbi:MAG: BLUF domain-containing protein [Alkalilacustris sp.]